MSLECEVCKYNGEFNHVQITTKYCGKVKEENGELITEDLSEVFEAGYYQYMCPQCGRAYYDISMLQN